MTSRSQSAVSTARESLRNQKQKFQIPQPSLDFDAHESCGRNDDFVVRSAISSSIRRSEKSRTQIAELMTEALGQRVTEQMLNTYSATSMSQSRLPAAWIRAFCKAVEDDGVLMSIAEAGGYRLIRDEEVELLELGREYLRQRRASENVALLEKRLSGVEI